MSEKIKKINVANLVITCIIFIFEIMPQSVKMAWSGGPNNPSKIQYVSYIMDPGLMLWGIGFLTLILVLFTISILIINAVMLSNDNNKLRISSVVLNFISLIGSIILVAIMREHVTLQNIFIIVFFFIQTILHFYNLRLKVKENKLNSGIEKL